MLSTHHNEIREDGVAYWIFVEMVSLYFAIPLCLLGTLIGWIIDLVKNKWSNQNMEPTVKTAGE